MPQVSDKNHRRSPLSIWEWVRPPVRTATVSYREICEQPPLNHTVISDTGTSGEEEDLERVNLLGGSALSVGENGVKKKKLQFFGKRLRSQENSTRIHSHWVNNDFNQTDVLCRCCSSALRHVTIFLFVVLEEDGELLQGLVSGPETWKTNQGWSEQNARCF